MQEIALLESKQLREQAISRIEVLEKVKHLLLIPKLEVLTLKQIAEYYEVPFKTLESCYNYNRKEIDPDGVTLVSVKDFLNLEVQCLEKGHYQATFKINDSVTVAVPNRGIRVFPKRAILRIGMLLRDSPIAKEVRTQILYYLLTSGLSVRPTR